MKNIDVASDEVALKELPAYKGREALTFAPQSLSV